MQNTPFESLQLLVDGKVVGKFAMQKLNLRFSTTLELVKKSGNLPCTSATKGMTQSYGTTFRVYLK